MFSFFKRKENNTAANFLAVKTDMHSHLIPGIDDGAKTIEDSLALIKELHSLGYTKLITTPHIMSDFYRNTPEGFFVFFLLALAVTIAPKFVRVDADCYNP